MRGLSIRLTLLTRLCLTTLLPLSAVIGCGNNDANSTSARNPNGAGPAPVDFGTAGDHGAAAGYAVLAKTAITNTGTSAITGDLGLSPAAASFISGFPSELPAGGSASTSPQVSGKIYASDYAVPTPANLTSAIGKMETAYTDAAGRTTPDFTELATGNLGGLTLTPGLYKWTNTVTIPADFAIAGGANDVWIFQIAGDLTMSAAKRVTLSGGASAKNIIWQVAGQVTLGTTAHLEGTVLCKTAITLQTGASLTGRALAQSQIALAGNMVTLP